MLSPSIEAFDLGEKVEDNQQLETSQEYIFLDARQPLLVSIPLRFTLSLGLSAAANCVTLSEARTHAPQKAIACSLFEGDIAPGRTA